MTVSTPNSSLGRHMFGVAALASGLITLAWHDSNDGHQLRYVVYAAAAALLFGGAAIQFRRTAKAGAAVLGAAYLVFVLLSVLGIVAEPQIYNSWGNFFEQFSLLSGAAIVYARLSSAWPPETLTRIGRILLGICAASFTLEQAIYLDATAKFVPKLGSAHSDVLGGNNDCFVCTRGCGSTYESNGTSRDSPADNDAPDLWATGVGTVASFGSPQSYELERKRRDLRDCRSSMDSRGYPRRVSAC
jgi:hypothetical protein